MTEDDFPDPPRASGDESLLPICARCMAVATLFPAPCDEKPEEMAGPIGMYHCPDCGSMVCAGFAHPPLCADCIKEQTT